MVIKIPPDIEQKATLNCALCGKSLTPQEATAGIPHANGSLALAHSAHMQGRTEWLVGWAMFVACERHTLLTQGTIPLSTNEMAG